MIAAGSITGNESTDWVIVKESPIHIALDGSFGSGSIAVEQDLQGTVSTVRDNGTEIGITSDDNSSYNFQAGDVIRLTMSGATSPSVKYKISGVES